MSLSLFCCKATGGYPPEIVTDDRFSLDNIQNEADDNGNYTGKFRKMRPVGVTNPRGDWPSHWSDVVHEFDGHGIGVVGNDRTGEDMLLQEIKSFYVQHGVEAAVDDVSGSWLNPAMFRDGRAVEMDLFKSMGIHDSVPRSE